MDVPLYCGTSFFFIDIAILNGKMEIKAVIFDLDGTLLNSIEDIADANNMMLEEFGYPTQPLNKYLDWIRNGALALVKASLPLEKRKDDISSYVDRFGYYYHENLNIKSSLYPNIDKVLDLLTENNIPFAIHTNKSQHLTQIVVEKHFQLWNFKDVLGQSERFPGKPSPLGALYLAEQINCPPQNILFVGDSLIDMQTARAAGMMPLGVSWGFGEPKDGIHDVKMVHSPQEMIDYLLANIKKS